MLKSPVMLGEHMITLHATAEPIPCTCTSRAHTQPADANATHTHALYRESEKDIEGEKCM